MGGHITYQHLDTNTYAVKLRVYRDCNPGTVAFSTLARFEYLDSAGTVLHHRWVPKGPTIPLDTDTIGCVITPPGVCIEYADYWDTINLPPLAGGYLLEFSSCCRNAAIVNLPNPLNTGYTYNTNIPAYDSLGNSSPRFAATMPVLICLNKPINLPLPVVADSTDSLHYELCDIYNQGGYPYQSLTFNPPYSNQYPMPANPPFSVHPQSGQISGTPTQLGQYVLGICVHQFRAGEKLSTVRIDYQFNVTNCTTIYSDILTQAEDSSLYCMGLNMQFTSENKNASNYFWDFGDTTTLADTSHLQNPSYHYQSPGSYLVTLIVKAGTNCVDTATTIFEVMEVDTPGFTLNSSYCFSEQPIQFSGGTSYPANASFLWQFSGDASIGRSALRDPPPVSWASGGDHQVKLKVNFGKCSLEFIDTVRLAPELHSEMQTPADDSLMNCRGLDIRLISSSANADSLFWNFGDPTTLADTAVGDTVYYNFPSQGIYPITLIARQDGGCSDTLIYELEVFPQLSPRPLADGQMCFEAQDITLLAVGNYADGTRFEWQLGPKANRSSVTGSMVSGIQFSEPGTYPYSLTAVKANCRETVFDTLEIPAWTFEVEAGENQAVGLGELFHLSASSAAAYYWFASDPVRFSSPFGQSTTLELLQAGDTVQVYLRATGTGGCQGMDTLKVYMEDANLLQPANFISPDGDGNNDFFDLSHLMNGRDCEFTIMNRWGSEVYHAGEYQNDWAGVDDQGRLLPDGTYYYILFCNRRLTLTGPITIIRNR